MGVEAVIGDRKIWLFAFTVIGLSANGEGDTEFPVEVVRRYQASILRLMIHFDHNLLERSDRNNRTPFILAAALGHAHLLAELFTLKANVFARTHDGFTAMHYAAASGHTHLLPVLHQMGLAYDVRTNGGDMPLHSAAQKGHKRTVDFLAQHTDVSRVNNAYNTPLHLVALHGADKASMVIRLFRRGASLEQKNIFGQTPLHIAARLAKAEQVKSLILLGASHTVINRFGQRPIDVKALSLNEELLTCPSRYFERHEDESDRIRGKIIGSVAPAGSFTRWHISRVKPACSLR